MSKKKFIALIAVVVFLTITIISALFTVRSQASASSPKTTTVHLAFSGLVTKGEAKGSAITGGLTEFVQSDGFFSGNLHIYDGTKISTGGKLHDGKLSITFYDTTGTPVIRGAGRITKVGNFVGTFQVFYQNETTDFGIWSALPVTNSKKVVALDFSGNDTQGPDQGTAYNGAIILHTKTHKGTLNAPDGSIIPVSVTFGKNGSINISFHLSRTIHINGNGLPSNEDSIRGVQGSFHGPKAGDTGQWYAYHFSF